MSEIDMKIDTKIDMKIDIKINTIENWYDNQITCVVGLVERLGGLGVSRDILQQLE